MFKYRKIMMLLLFLSFSPLSVYAAPIKIMPLGDSITGSPGCWRAILWQSLQDNGFTDVDFVGTLPPQGCSIPDYDGDNEGHGGILVTNLANNGEFPGWLDDTDPDIVLMHMGTNDAWSSRSTEQILQAYTTLVNHMREHNPDMVIIVAQIIPLEPEGYNCSECPNRVIQLNEAIPGWARQLSTSRSPIIVVDQWTGFDVSDDTYDGVHPVDSGNRKIAGKWYPALAQVLSGSTAPSNPADEPLIGDVNEDGDVDVQDALLIAQYYVGLNPRNFNDSFADINRDGNIDIVDALQAARCGMNLDSCR